MLNASVNNPMNKPIKQEKESGEIVNITKKINLPSIMKRVTVVIETPRHSIGKYILDEEKKCYRLKKILPLGMVFPYDFGFIKGTRGEDGDPLDAMVITECNTYPGVEMTCRVIGALLATQTQHGKETIRNDRFFFIPEDSLAYGHVHDMKDFGRKHNQQLADFFINYNKAERKKFEPLKLLNAAEAEKLLGKQLH